MAHRPRALPGLGRRGRRGRLHRRLLEPGRRLGARRPHGRVHGRARAQDRRALRLRRGRRALRRVPRRARPRRPRRLHRRRRSAHGRRRAHGRRALDALARARARRPDQRRRAAVRVCAGPAAPRRQVPVRPVPGLWRRHFAHGLVRLPGRCGHGQPGQGGRARQRVHHARAHARRPPVRRARARRRAARAPGRGDAALRGRDLARAPRRADCQDQAVLLLRLVGLVLLHQRRARAPGPLRGDGRERARLQVCARPGRHHRRRGRGPAQRRRRALPVARAAGGRDRARGAVPQARRAAGGACAVAGAALALVNARLMMSVCLQAQA
eukprot:Unigene4812_Nuclearia_a/m.14716 Unigene4812_Nuclearia_a/g.14716  ORF Unigene4812_Nuclearia_a/g.14716 Unigene4812_Nuclearia_a/m.14716 type:complete len:326 (+) Unigene4812_Nuclearia_a:412-1389(+)